MKVFAFIYCIVFVLAQFGLRDLVKDEIWRRFEILLNFSNCLDYLEGISICESQIIIEFKTYFENWWIINSKAS